MQDIQLFNFHDHQVRSFEKDGEVWFIAKDVATVLGYSDTSQAIRKHCKGGVDSTAPSNGGVQTVKIIPERDVYRLIMRSRLPEAEAFEEWVVSEVLPAIRKTGGYSVASQLPDFTSPAEAARAWADEVEAKQVAEAKAAELEVKIQEDAPKVDFAHAVATIADDKTINQAAKVLGIGPNKLHAWMRDNVWCNADRSPSQARVNQGHLKYKHGSRKHNGSTIPTISTRITPRGFELLFKRLKEGGLI